MAGPPIVVDGHTHIVNRVYWERIDPWQPQPFGFDFARAFASGVNVIIENVAPYGYANFDQTPKQTLRLADACAASLPAPADPARARFHRRCATLSTVQPGSLVQLDEITLG